MVKLVATDHTTDTALDLGVGVAKNGVEMEGFLKCFKELRDNAIATVLSAVTADDGVTPVSRRYLGFQLAMRFHAPKDYV